MDWVTLGAGQSPGLDSLKRDRTVDLWRWPLHQLFDRGENALAGLSMDERERVEGMTVTAGYRFATVRSWLRQILGQYLGIPPGEVEFAYGEHGKPMLAHEFADAGLEFSVSYSGGLALYGVAHGCRIGVDVERLIARHGMLEIAEQFFSPEEAGAIAASAPDQQAAAFLSHWTTKEAYLKARGLGLSAPRAESELGADLRHATGWSVRNIDVGPGFVAAVAVEGPIRALRGWAR